MTFADDAEAGEAVQIAIREALIRIVGENGGMLGHFVMVAEVAEITNEDDTDLCTFFVIAERQKAWHSIGLLGYGLAIEKENLD